MWKGIKAMLTRGYSTNNGVIYVLDKLMESNTTNSTSSTNAAGAVGMNPGVMGAVLAGMLFWLWA